MPTVEQGSRHGITLKTQFPSSARGVGELANRRGGTSGAQKQESATDTTESARLWPHHLLSGVSLSVNSEPDSSSSSPTGYRGDKAPGARIRKNPHPTLHWR